MFEFDFFMLLIGFIDFFIIFWFMHKIENKRLSKKGIGFGIFLASFSSYFYNFIVLIFEMFFPLLSSILLPALTMVLIFVLFNNYFSNDYKASLVKTLIIFVFLNFAQLSSMILFPVFSLVISYEELSSILGFIAQGWSVMIIALFYNKISPFMDKIIKSLYRRFDLVGFGLLYILFVIVIFKLGLKILVSSTLSLIMGVTIFGIGFLGIGYLIYKFAPKNKQIR